MKCDLIRTRMQGDTPFFPNMLNNGKVEVCLKEDVDAAIAELKEEVNNLLMQNRELCQALQVMYSAEEYTKLQAENAELKQKLAEKESWVKMLGEGEVALSLELEKTKQKLENVQASMYADVVDANMEIRRLRRALWIARANRAL